MWNRFSHGSGALGGVNGKSDDHHRAFLWVSRRRAVSGPGITNKMHVMLLRPRDNRGREPCPLERSAMPYHWGTVGSSRLHVRPLTAVRQRQYLVRLLVHDPYLPHIQDWLIPHSYI